MSEVIHLPALPPPTNRQRLDEIKKMQRNYVGLKVIQLKTWSKLRNMEKLLKDKIKEEDNGRGPNSPRGRKPGGPPKRTA